MRNLPGSAAEFHEPSRIVSQPSAKVPIEISFRRISAKCCRPWQYERQADALSRNKALIAGITVTGESTQTEFREPGCLTSWSEVNPMRKTLIALVAAATVLATTFASSNKAEAWWGWWPGAVIGGVVAGAIVGSAIAPRPYYPYGYYGPYYGPYPYGPRCPRVWNGYAWVPAC
jgi:hypothetical protein